jgi:hypothetical protein
MHYSNHLTSTTATKLSPPRGIVETSRNSCSRLVEGPMVLRRDALVPTVTLGRWAFSESGFRASQPFRRDTISGCRGATDL